MKHLILTFLLFLTFGCSDDDAIANSEPQNISPALVAKGFMGSNNRFSTENRVITTNAQWHEIMESMEAAREGITENFNETIIDFDTHIVIASYMIGSSGTTIDVTRVIENEDNVVVTLENLRKGATQDVVHPFNIVKIPRTSKPIIFEDLTDWNN